jgi:hypothetical protein
VLVAKQIVVEYMQSASESETNNLQEMDYRGRREGQGSLDMLGSDSCLQAW